MTLLQTAKPVFGSSVSSMTATFGSSVTNGSLLVFGMDLPAATPITTVTDTGGNQWQIANAIDGTFERCELWYAWNVKGGASFSITANLGSSAAMLMMAREYSGSLVKDPKQLTTLGTGSSTACTAGTMSIFRPNPLLIACVAQNASAATYTAGTGWGNATNGDTSGTGRSRGMEDHAATVNGDYVAAITSSANQDFAMVAAAFDTISKGIQPNKVRPHIFSPGLAR
jgi:hypothetical protein